MKKTAKNKNATTHTSLWGGRFSAPADQQMWDYSKSIQIDSVLAPYDLRGSIAHVRMLEQCGHLKPKESQKICGALKKILSEYTRGTLALDMSSEDIHSNIEALLYEKIGALAGKMHIGRSRNDQVAVDLHMYVRDTLHNLVDLLSHFIEVLTNKADQHIDTIFPGYTHMQRAEPIRVAHHFLAYVSMFSRDVTRLQDIWKRVNISPLGAGAFAGSPIPIDNTITASLLHFDGVYENSMDAVSDRDFAVELLSCLSLIQMHISKFSEELILWSSHEFSFIEIDDVFCTGSSMMPQKKNPDVAELARGKTGSVYGGLMSLLTTLKGLPLSYNRDLQEDKKPLFESIHTVSQTISLFTRMVDTIKTRDSHCLHAAEHDFSNATEIANYLARKGIPFREAHAMSGTLVKKAIALGVFLKDLPLSEYQKVSPLITQDVYKSIAVHAIIEKHTVRGGTSKKSVKFHIRHTRKTLLQIQKWLSAKRAALDLNLTV